MRKQNEFNVLETLAEIERLDREIKELNNPEVISKKVEEVFGNKKFEINWTEVWDKALKEVNM